MRDRNITVSIRSESSQSLNDLFRSTLELVEDIQEKHYIGTLFFSLNKKLAVMKNPSLDFFEKLSTNRSK
jgi:hypothetical protein